MTRRPKDIRAVICVKLDSLNKKYHFDPVSSVQLYIPSNVLLSHWTETNFLLIFPANILNFQWSSSSTTAQPFWPGFPLLHPHQFAHPHLTCFHCYFNHSKSDINRHTSVSLHTKYHLKYTCDQLSIQINFLRSLPSTERANWLQSRRPTWQ